MQDLEGNLPVPPDMHARIRQAFLLGLARQPVVPPPSLTGLLPRASEPALALLALAGQRQRFAGPPRPAAGDVPDAARRMHADPRPILPPGARRALNRLAGSVEKSQAGGVMPIALRRISMAGCRPHPFDLPDLARHIKADAENVGLAERAYLALIAPEADEDAVKALFFDRITADNWITFPKAQRRTFVAAMRRDNPAEGRALVESVWKTEPAPVRAALLEALAVGLGAADKPFLDRLATDRADSVKQAALRLLARMPTAEAFRQRVAAAAQCFKRTGKGVGRVMAALGIGGEGTLTFAPPGELTFAALDLLFSGMPLQALADAVGVSPGEIIAALPEDEHHVRNLLFDSAVEADNTATVQSIIKARLFASQALAGHVIMPLATAARLPVDQDTAARLLASPAWRKAIGELAAATTAVPKDDGRFVFTAALMPREAMPDFVASLAPLNPVTTRAARDFADLILALPDRPQPVSGASP
jgi:hypothetical protein